MEWIKCSERMPPAQADDGFISVTVLCCSSVYDEPWIGWFSYEDFTWTTNPSNDHPEKYMPCYWMLLPDNPE